MPDLTPEQVRAAVASAFKPVASALGTTQPATPNISRPAGAGALDLLPGARAAFVGQIGTLQSRALDAIAAGDSARAGELFSTARAVAERAHKLDLWGPSGAAGATPLSDQQRADLARAAVERDPVGVLSRPNGIGALDRVAGARSQAVSMVRDLGNRALDATARGDIAEARRLADYKRQVAADLYRLDATGQRSTADKP
jgi:hypothetical protein